MDTVVNQAVRHKSCDPGVPPAAPQPEPSLRKADITRRYDECVPAFPEKAFGRAVWDDYLNGPIAPTKQSLKPFSECVSFLRAAREVVARHTPATEAKP